MKTLSGHFAGYPYEESDHFPEDTLYLMNPSGVFVSHCTLNEFLEEGITVFPALELHSKDNPGFCLVAKTGFRDKFMSRLGVKPKSNGSPEYLKLLEGMADLHRRKNAGYAGHSDDPWSNFRECEKFGVDCFTGVLVRMSDKWSRITSLVQNPANEQVGESIKDTLKDLAAYALIASILYDEHHDTD